MCSTCQQAVCCIDRTRRSDSLAGVLAIEGWDGRDRAGKPTGTRLRGTFRRSLGSRFAAERSKSEGAVQLSIWGLHTQIFGDNINREEIDFAGGIAAIIASALNHIMRVDKAHGGLDLNAPEAAAGVGDEVVALAVSPDTGDAEAEMGGFGEESGFGGLAMRLTRGEADGMDFGNDG